MKKLIVVAAVLALSACSSTKLATDNPSSEAVKFTQDFGKVEVTFNDKGEWESLKSSATSAVPIGVDAGLEQGMNVANMRAKRNIVEFINQDLKSKTTTDAITKSLSKNISEDDTASKQRAANIAEEITEKISVESNGILKGVYVLERKVSSDTKYVVVTVQVDKRSMNAARQLRVAMGN
jgi:uncharacterized protein with gpF-like domain